MPSTCKFPRNESVSVHDAHWLLILGLKSWTMLTVRAIFENPGSQGFVPIFVIDIAISMRPGRDGIAQPWTCVSYL